MVRWVQGVERVPALYRNMIHNRVNQLKSVVKQHHTYFSVV